jgi:hypothetical protein
MPKGRCADPEKEAERARKISAARKAKMASLGFLNSPETREKIRIAQIGRAHTDEQRAKNSQSKRGRRPANFAQFLAAAHAAPKPTGADKPNWKGDAVGYSALHGWVRRQLGRPSNCERCGNTQANRYEWANRSRQYKREVADWERLCVSCHRKDGYLMGEYAAMRKET